ncbi:hypothetical protein RM423_05705 [Jatrophihabitans sp. DSM 44399]|uniref:Uncharacterized protein n=1 Tax=Jatrophihabitans lederbergiae TaxID=3075547 RepID=A0ABU2J814_9ACTN|nr:hypothetical protein [Jatrophihabitans sp. DSM 44399]MDT0260886.1 hypothetical protein [Jatrophihabitans sp. DSM 44399]
MQTLDADVEQDDADDQHPEVAGAGEDQPGRTEQQREGADGDVTVAAILQPARGLRAQHTGRADQAERADGRGRVAEGRGCEQRRQRGPEQLETGEAQGPDEHPPTQEPLLANEADDRAEQPGVTAGPLGHRQDRQRQEQDDGKQRDDNGGSDVDGPPARELAERSGHRSREQNAEQQAGHHGAEHPAALAVAREGGRERDQDVDSHARHPDAGERQYKHQRGPRHRCKGERDRACRQQRHRERSLGEQVAERNKKDQSERVAQLCRGDAVADPGRSAELPIEVRKKRLDVVDVRDDQAARDRHQQQQRAGYANCSLGIRLGTPHFGTPHFDTPYRALTRVRTPGRAVVAGRGNTHASGPYEALGQSAWSDPLLIKQSICPLTPVDLSGRNWRHQVAHPSVAEAARRYEPARRPAWPETTVRVMRET